MTRKRIIIALGALLVISIIGLLIYFGRKPSGIKQILPPLQPKSAAKPAVPSAKPKAISDKEVLKFWIAGEAEKVFYLSSDGQIAEAKEGADTYLTGNGLPNPVLALPSPDSEKVLVGFRLNDSYYPQFSLFNLTSASWRPFEIAIEAVAWSPSSDEIAILERSGENKNLVLTDLEGQIKRKILKNIGLEDMVMEWPEPEAILFYSKPSGFNEGELWTFNLERQTFEKLIASSEKTAGLTWKWSAAAGLGFMSTGNGELGLTDSKTRAIMTLSANTLADKCAADEDNLYCFVPQSIPTGIVLPDDYLQGKVYFRDNLFKINLETREGRIILASNEGFAADGRDPQVMNGRLYFINRYDDRVYLLDL